MERSGENDRALSRDKLDHAPVSVCHVWERQQCAQTAQERWRMPSETFYKVEISSNCVTFFFKALTLRCLNVTDKQ